MMSANTIRVRVRGLGLCEQGQGRQQSAKIRARFPRTSRSSLTLIGMMVPGMMGRRLSATANTLGWSRDFALPP